MKIVALIMTTGILLGVGLFFMGYNAIEPVGPYAFRGEPVRTIASITEKFPFEHQSLKYRYEVDGSVYEGLGGANLGNGKFETLKVNDSIIIHYDKLNPSASFSGIPDYYTDNRLFVSSVLAVLMPLPITILSIVIYLANRQSVRSGK